MMLNGMIQKAEEYADVTAKDFVWGIKYAADNKSEMLYIIQDSIRLEWLRQR